MLREKIGLDVDDLQKAEDHIRRCTRLVEPTEKLDVVQSDPDDNRVLECAVAADADTVVSGDLDLLRMGSFREIRILRVSEFLVGFQARER